MQLVDHPRTTDIFKMLMGEGGKKEGPQLNLIVDTRTTGYVYVFGCCFNFDVARKAKPLVIRKRNVCQVESMSSQP